MDWSSLPLSLVAQGGATALLSLVVLLILSGRLVPSSIVERLLRQQQEQTARVEQAAARDAESITRLTEAVGAMTDIGETSNALLRALHQAAIDGPVPGRDRR